MHNVPPKRPTRPYIQTVKGMLKMKALLLLLQLLLSTHTGTDCKVLCIERQS